MRHECSCGHTLAPRDAAEPVDAISHGLCARCMAKVLRARKSFWYPVRLNGYEVRLLVQPGHEAPHVGPDSPRYWEGPRPFHVLDSRVSRDGVELDPAEYRDLLSVACERANVPAPGRPGRTGPASSRQMRLRLNGLLRTAMERTGYIDGGAA